MYGPARLSSSRSLPLENARYFPIPRQSAQPPPKRGPTGDPATDECLELVSCGGCDGQVLRDVDEGPEFPPSSVTVAPRRWVPASQYAAVNGAYAGEARPGQGVHHTASPYSHLLATAAAPQGFHHGGGAEECTYEFAGPDAGFQQPPPWQLPRRGLSTFFMFGLTVLGFGGLFVFAVVSFPSLIPPSSPAFDCEAGFDNWERGWSHSKQLYCCKTVGLGCASYDCEADYADRGRSWSLSKKAWCCQYAGRGCPPDSRFDCRAGLAEWSTGWSLAKKEYCCAHEGTGCERDTPLPLPSPMFDCRHGFADRDWSPAKTQWCCANLGKGCEIAMSVP